MATLTTVKGVYRTLQENVPSEALDVTANYGRVRVLYDYYTVASADEFGTDGLIRLFNIPKGARVLDFEVSVEAAGATGIFDLGWAASAELDSDGVAVVAADADGFFAAVDPGAAAVNRQVMPSTRPGYMKKFDASVEVQADFTEVTADSGGDTFEFVCYIAVD